MGVVDWPRPTSISLYTLIAQLLVVPVIVLAVVPPSAGTGVTFIQAWEG